MGALVVLAVVLAAAAPALAQPYPGERAADAQVAAEVGIASSYWQARGVVGCPAGIAAWFADDLMDSDGVDAMGRGGACAVWLSWPKLVPYRGLLGAEESFVRRFGLEVECMVVVHEMGHALGLGHTEDGIMAAGPLRLIPAECTRWAWTVVPPRRRPERERHARRRPNVRVAFGALR